MTFSAVENPALENKLLNLLIAHALNFGFGRQAVFDDLRGDSFHIQATAVVRDLNDDVAARMESIQRNQAGIGLVGGLSPFRRLQTVVRGVTNHVGQGILDHLQDLTIQFRIRAEHFQFDFFTGL